MENIISQLRQEHGLTQQMLAEKLSVSRQTIISLETGRYNPSIRLAWQISRLFGLTIEDVFIFTEDEQNEKIK